LNDLFGEANSFFDLATKDVGELLGQVAARFKRYLLDDASQAKREENGLLSGLLSDWPSAANVKSVLDSVGVEANDDVLGELISDLEGEDINKLIQNRSDKVRLRLQLSILAVMI
jgi:hypothetical protein